MRARSIPGRCWHFCSSAEQRGNLFVSPGNIRRQAKLPLHIREEIAEARVFSETMHGAAILYNLMLAEKRAEGHAEESSSTKELVRDYRDDLKNWARGNSFAPIPSGWPTQRFWEMVLRGNPRISPRTREFVNTWAVHAQEVRSGGAPDTPIVRRLILARELATKGANQARLQNVGALARWNEAAGMGQMRFRWNRRRTYRS